MISIESVKELLYIAHCLSTDAPCPYDKLCEPSTCSACDFDRFITSNLQLYKQVLVERLVKETEEQSSPAESTELTGNLVNLSDWKMKKEQK